MHDHVLWPIGAHSFILKLYSKMFAYLSHMLNTIMGTSRTDSSCSYLYTVQVHLFSDFTGERIVLDRMFGIDDSFENV